MNDDDVMVEMVIRVKRNGDVWVDAIRHPECALEVFVLLAAGALADAQGQLLRTRKFNEPTESQP